MRIRSIKPEFWRSDDITTLLWDTRLLFVGLWSYVDDNGVGIDRLASVVADLFSGDLERNPPETFARVSRGLQELSDAGRIVRYSVEGKAYLEIVNWERHQRIDKPNKPRFPRSDAFGAEIRETFARVTGKESSGTEEQRNRGTEEQRKEKPSSPRGDGGAFAAFYMAYPRKVGKEAARKAFERASRTTSAQVIIDAAKAFAVDPNLPEKQFIAHPATWLNRGSWEDEALPPRDGRQPGPDSDPELDWMRDRS